MNRNFIKHCFLTLSIVAMCIPAQADNEPISFVADGIYYKQFAESGWEDCVYVMPLGTGAKYEGAVVIPDMVNHNGQKYFVLGIGDNCFKDCTELTSVKIEAQGIFIGNSAFENCTGLEELTVGFTDLWNWPSNSGGLQNRVGYRAFFGCRLKKFTLDAFEQNPPVYEQRNPSNNYSTMTDNMICNWFDINDYWTVGEYPVEVWNYTTFYVPAGSGGYYIEDDHMWYQQWRQYFSNIREFGADADDYVFEMKYDTIPEFTHYADSIRDIGHGRSNYAQFILQEYIDSLAQAQGIEPDYTQLEAAFDKVEITDERMGTETVVNMIPDINKVLTSVYNHLGNANEIYYGMEEWRKQYYEAKNWCKHYTTLYGSNVDDKMSEIEMQKEQLTAKSTEMRNYVYRAAENLAYLVDFGPTLFEKEMWDFINAFKLKQTSVTGITKVEQHTDAARYNLNGQHVFHLTKGIIIQDGKKIILK